VDAGRIVIPEMQHLDCVVFAETLRQLVFGGGAVEFTGRMDRDSIGRSDPLDLRHHALSFDCEDQASGLGGGLGCLGPGTGLIHGGERERQIPLEAVRPLPGDIPGSVDGLRG
jgi:hypothetical protein